MAAPAVVLKRPVGSIGSFTRHAELPTDISGSEATKRGGGKSVGRKLREQPKPKSDSAADRKSALAFEREQERRQRERAKEEDARRKEQERRQRAVTRAQDALSQAREKHDKNASALQASVEVLEQRLRAEAERWEKEKARLEAALKRARGQSRFLQLPRPQEVLGATKNRVRASTSWLLYAAGPSQHPLDQVYNAVANVAPVRFLGLGL